MSEKEKRSVHDGLFCCINVCQKWAAVLQQCFSQTAVRGNSLTGELWEACLAIILWKEELKVIICMDSSISRQEAPKTFCMDLKEWEQSLKISVQEQHPLESFFHNIT